MSTRQPVPRWAAATLCTATLLVGLLLVITFNQAQTNSYLQGDHQYMATLLSTAEKQLATDREVMVAATHQLDACHATITAILTGAQPMAQSTHDPFTQPRPKGEPPYHLTDPLQRTPEQDAAHRNLADKTRTLHRSNSPRDPTQHPRGKGETPFYLVGVIAPAPTSR